MFKIKNLLIDLDDTILDFKKSEAQAIKNTLAFFGTEPTAEIIRRYSEINSSMWKKLERGEMTRARMRTERFKILFSEIGVSISSNEAKEVYEGELSKTVFFIPEAMETLEILSDSYALYLASNGTAAVQKGRIAASGIAKFFKEIFISDIIGYNKPSREFFEYCFEKIPDFKQEETLIVGDSLTSDIQGGINAGIRTCLFNPTEKAINGTAVPNYQIKSLKELPLILKTVN